MNNISVDTFEKNLKDCVKKVIYNHNPLKVNNENGEDFIVISQKERIVYKFDDKYIYILAIGGHYDQFS